MQLVTNKMYLWIPLIGLTCLVVPGLAQRGFRQGQQCYTPENGIGQCFTLSYCPFIANVLNEYPRNVAVRYLRAAKQSCGNVVLRGDPVVCCDVSQQIYNNQPQPPPSTSSPQNPFFPTSAPPTLPPIIIAPTPEPFTPRPQPTTQAPVQTKVEEVSNRQDKAGAQCQDPDTLYGSCKPLAQCPDLIARLQSNPNDATFVRYLKASNSICQNQYAVVCCPDANQQIKSLPIFPRNTQDIPTKLPSMADGCGYVNNEFRKIVGGTTSKVGAWPWIALIGYDDGGLSASPFKCGGALITSRHVLTAAHCIRSDLTFVRLGEHDLNTETEANHVDIPVVKRLRHPRYNRTDGHNDIALLYLGQNVQFSEKVTPICIPFSGQIRTRDITGYTPFVAGWGRTMEGGKSATVLQELQIPIYTNANCKELYRKQGKFISEEQFDNAVLCAGDLSGGKDTCQGDSGGPLMLPEKYEASNRFHLIGIVSYGIGCARPMIPGVYSRVTNFIDWIQNGVADTP